MVRACTVHVFTLDCRITIFTNIHQGLKTPKSAQILQGNPLLSEGTHIIIPLTKFEEHVFILLLVSCPDKHVVNQALIAKHFVKLHLKTLYPCINCFSPCTCLTLTFIHVNYTYLTIVTHRLLYLI